jgi:hypothetical protein
VIWLNFRNKEKERWAGSSWYRRKETVLVFIFHWYHHGEIPTKQFE